MEPLLQAPCILFIDEFDGLGKQRSSSMGGDDESVHTINQLLTGASLLFSCRHAPQHPDNTLYRNAGGRPDVLPAMP